MFLHKRRNFLDSLDVYPRMCGFPHGVQNGNFLTESLSSATILSTSSEPSAVHLEIEELPQEREPMTISLEAREIPTTETTTTELQRVQQFEVREEEAPTKGKTIMEIQMKEQPLESVTMVLEAPEAPEEPKPEEGTQSMMMICSACS